MNTKLIAALAFAGSFAAAGSLASAETAAQQNGDAQRESSALQTAKISLTQAIAIAEQRTGGKAYDAGVSLKGARTRIAVETSGRKGVQTTFVDAWSGKIVETHAGAEAD
jgi:uncharacterized membrane protein YkoI